MKKGYSSNFIIGLALTSIMVGLIVIGFIWTPYDPDAMQADLMLSAPDSRHLFGTDQFGRDVFSRVLRGASSTFIAAIGAIFIGGTIGGILGGITGYFGGWLDEILMRVNDALATFPSILIALVIISVLGSGTMQIVLALGIAFIPSYARMVRGEFLRIRQLDYITSAKLIKVKPFRIIFSHIMPNIMPVLMSSLAIGFNNAVLAEAGLSYLGIGVQPPNPSLGRMISEGQTYLASGPWYVIFPGLFLVLLILGVSMLGEGILERSDRV